MFVCVAAVAELGAQEAAKPETGPVPDKSTEEKPAVAIDPRAWSEADTRLANHYIRLLERNPENGNVLELLWGLYEKKDQTQLLLDYIEGAAWGEEGSIVAKILFAHLLRKNEDIDRSREFYNEVLALDSENVIALRGAAEISDQQQRWAKALSLYTRLVERTPVGTEDGVAFRLRQAALLRQSDRLDKAVAIWNEILAAWPANTVLRTEIVSLLMEAGRTEDAIAVLEGLAESGDPGLRLTSLESLSRLYQFISEFDGAAEALRKSLEVLHFKHHQHAVLFTRFVRLHERFGRLEELRTRLEAEASRPNPSEKAVFLMAEFYRLTANPVPQEQWSSRLANLVPGNVDYQVALAEIQMENDHYAGAAGTLDRLMASQAEIPLRLVFLRVRVALNLDGRESAESILRKFLQDESPSPDVLEKILAFSQEHYLDGLVEHLLRGPTAKDLAGGNDRESAPVELARFLRERGRTGQAIETLDRFVAEAGESTKLEASRLSEVSAAFRDLGLREEAVKAIDRAIALDPETRDYQLSKSELQIDGKEAEAALETLEAIWGKSSGLEAKTDIDQRMFSLLRGMADPEQQRGGGPGRIVTPPPGGRITTLSQYRQLAAAASSNNGREADEPPPKRLMEFYRGILDQAVSEPSLENRYRAAWWSFKLQDFTETYTHLTAAQAEAGKPVLEVEKMLFDLAEQNERLPFMAKHLETLATIDPENAREYRQRRAEVRFLLGYEDEAIRELETLAADPDASLNTLKTLATVYLRQGRSQSQIRVWQDAYRRADLFEKRRIIKQLATAFIELDQPEEALKVQMDLTRSETDLVQKRKQLDAQLSVASRHYLLGWLRDRYTELSQQNPFERFYPEALARIHRAVGDYEAAFLALKRAYYMSGQDSELLSELGELAGRTKDLKSAIYYHRQLIAQAEEGADAESWKSLIGMLERDLRVPEADRMRRRLEGKFAQDADFLKQLAREYTGGGRYVEAERVLDQLTALRPWDAAAWLELGLIRREIRGDTERALAAFEKAIAETAESALPPDEERFSRYTIIAGGWFSGQGTPPDRGGLSSFAEGVRTHYPSIEAGLQNKLIDWLDEPKPEFYRVPRKPVAIRLRAIEEAARLHGSGDSREAWAQRWSGEGISPTERLWALHYAGLGDEAYRVLSDHLLPPENSVERLVFAVLSLRMKQDEKLLSWARDNRGNVDGTERDRRVFPLLAGGLLIREMVESGEPGIEDGTIVRLLTELEDSYLTGSHYFSLVRSGGDHGRALRIGRILSEGVLKDSGDFHYLMAEAARDFGDDEANLYWLRRSLAVMKPSDNPDLADPGLPIRYFAALTETHALLESATERRAFLDSQERRLEAEANAPDWVKTENRAMIGLVGRNSSAALGSLRQLLTDVNFLTRRSPRSYSFQFERVGDLEPWSMRERVLMQFMPRRFAGLDPIALHAATGDVAAPPPVSLDIGTRERYEQYEIKRLVWLLEKLGPPERARRVEEMVSLFFHPDSFTELATMLEARGFHREAIPIYRRLIEEKPADISPLRGFFGACRKALEYEPALALIQRYLDRQVPPPNGLTPDYLSQNHAEFLYMARDVETLAAKAREPVPPPDAAPRRNLLIAENQNPWRYHNALIRVHARRGQADALLRMLGHLRDRGQVTESDRVLAAGVLRKQGKLEEAIEWLRGVQFDQQQTIVEAAAIRELAELYTSSEPAARARLLDLSRTALEYRDTDLILEIAGKLHGAGARTEARSCLLLEARKKDTAPADRTRLRESLIRMELNGGADFPAIAEEMQELVDGLARDDQTGLRDFAALVRDHGPAEIGAWSAYFDSIRAQPGKQLIAAMGMAALGEDAAMDIDRLADLVRDDEGDVGRVLEVLVMLGETGKTAARALLDRRERPFVTLFDGDPVRQVALLGELEDSTRAADLHARLLRETASERFHQMRNTDFQGHILNRAGVPRAFRDAGFPEMARALYQRYVRDLPRLTHEHSAFVEDYARFLIEDGDFGAAESALVPALQKSIGMKPVVLIDLYEAWGRLDEFAEMADKHFLSSGVRVELEEMRTARENGK